MKDIVIGLLSDCISYASNGTVVTGAAGAAASTAIGRMMQKRHEVLREIIRTEIRQGNFEGVDQDELTSVFFRLIRDAQEGVAKNNLHLMARVINGMAGKKELTAPTFLKYANILSSLTQEEIIVLSVMVKYPESWSKYVHEARAIYDHHGLKDEEVVQQALVRTGLIMMEIGSEAEARGIKSVGVMGNLEEKVSIRSWMSFSVSPLTNEILKYTDFFPKTEARDAGVA